MANQTLAQGRSTMQGTTYTATGDDILLDGNIVIMDIADAEKAGITIHSITGGTLDVQLTTDSEKAVWWEVLTDDGETNPFFEAEAGREFSVSVPTFMKITANGGDIEFSLVLKNE